MYIRVSRRKNKDGSVVEYAQLAHNYRDPVTGRPKAQILYNFGRREHIDEDALRRLIDSISRFLGSRGLTQEPARKSVGWRDRLRREPSCGRRLAPVGGSGTGSGIGAELVRLARGQRSVRGNSTKCCESGVDWQLRGHGTVVSGSA